MDNFSLPLSCPFTWRASKVCKFWNDVHNHLKHQVGTSGNVNPYILRFQERLDAKAIRFKILGSSGNWRDVLGEHHFRLVTIKEKNIDPRWMTSVTSLLRVIRNKHEHQDGLTDSDKSDLCWFRTVNEKYEFDNHLFARYWLDRFPCLLIFLWNEFATIKSSFREYFPNKLKFNMTRGVFGSGDFLHLFGNACADQVDHGYLNERFTCANSTCCIEVRILSGDLLSTLLDGSSFLKINILAENVLVEWNEDCRESMEYKVMPTLGKVHNSQLPCEIGTYIFVSGSDKVNENVIFENCSCEKSVITKTVIFTSEDALDGINNKFSSHVHFKKNSIGWNDLSDYQRKEIEFSDKFIFQIQKNEYKIWELLPKSKIFRQQILTQLEGATLNSLLRTNKLTLIKDHNIPNVEQFYRERRLYNLDKLHSIVFKKPPKNEIFIVIKLPCDNHIVNISDQFKVAKKHMIVPKTDLTNQCYILETTISDLDFVYETLETSEEWQEALCTKNIHFFRLSDESYFQWVKTFGTISNMESRFIKAARKAGMVTESKFLEDLENTNKQLIFIADQPGMGKSQVLVNLAGKMMRRRNSKTIVMLLSMSQLVDTFLKNCESYRKDGNSQFVLLNAIVKTIADLTCTDKFEEALITNLLRSGSKSVRVEIMLDGLDEVKSELKDFALDILQILNIRFKFAVRVWVTLRDHMWKSVMTKYNTLGYKLEPFTKNEQVRFLTDFWSKNATGRDKCKATKKSLRKFAKKCLERCLSIRNAELAGVPLQCRMIAEIFEHQVLKLDLIDRVQMRFNLNVLYKILLERKLEVYIREKKKLPVDISMNDFLVQVISDSIDRYIQYLAIQLVFSEEVANKFSSVLSVPVNPKSKTALSGMALEHGVVQNIDPLNFIHRTFAEYLVAQFVKNSLMHFFCHHKNLDDLEPDLQNFLWNNVLALKCENYKWTFEHPTLCHFLEESLHKLVMEKAPPESDSDPTEKDTFRDLIFYMNYFRFSQFYDSASFFFAAAGSWWLNTREHPNIIWVIAQSRARLTGLLIFTLLKQEYEAATFIIENMDFGPEHWHLIKNFDKRKFSFLHYLFQSYRNSSKEPSFDEEKSFIKYLLEKDATLLHDRDALGKTPVLFLLNSVLPYGKAGWRDETAVKTLEFLIGLGADIHAVDGNQNTILHLGRFYDDQRSEESDNYNASFPLIGGTMFYVIPQGKYYSVIKFLLEMGCGTEINCFNSNGFTPLLSFLEVFDYHYKIGILWIYGLSNGKIREVMDYVLNLFRDYGMDLNLCNYDGKSVICKAIERELSFFIIEKLIEYGADVLAGDTYGEGALHKAVKMRDICLVKYLINQFPSCLYVREISGKTVMEYQSSRVLRKYLQYKTTNDMSEYVSCSYSLS